VGSGELINPTAVYSTVEQGRLAQANKVTKRFIRTAEEAVSSKNAATTTKRGIIKSRILVIFMVFFCIIYFSAAKLIPSGKIISNFGLSSRKCG
jgi:hypothetical protein